jgi:hypothetical protein
MRHYRTPLTQFQQWGLVMFHSRLPVKKIGLVLLSLLALIISPFSLSTAVSVHYSFDDIQSIVKNVSL